MNFVLSLPWSISKCKEFQNDAIHKDFPDLKDIEFANTTAPWKGLDHNREYISFEKLNKSIFDKGLLQKANSKQLSLREIHYSCYCSNFS